MSTPEPTSGVPVWARKRKKPGNPLIGLVLVPLALLGGLTGALAIREKSFTGAGSTMDGWVAVATHRVHQVIGDADDKSAAPKAKKPAA